LVPMQGIVLVEKDVNNDVLAVWSFPSADADTKQVIRSRSGLLEDSLQPMTDAPFRFSKFHLHWMYQHSFPVRSAKNNKLVAACIAVTSATFNPAKYSALLACLVAEYQPEGDCSPLPLLSAYLSVLTTGSLKAGANHAGFEEKAHDDRRALLSPVKETFELFGADTILIWTAMLLKKRVFVYANKVSELLPVIRSFPLIGAWHRLDWDILRPLVTLLDVELDDLRAAGVFVAGFTDPSAANRKELHDLFVDISAKSVQVPEHAKAAFTLTKFHNDLIQAFLASLSDNDQAIIKLIATKTKELVSNVASLKTSHPDGSYITLEELEQKKLPLNMDRFLFNVALAERMTRS